MFIKIFFNGKALFLCDSIDEVIKPYLHRGDVVYLDELNGQTVKTMIHEMEQEDVNAGVFFHNDLDELTNEVKKKFSIIRAGGGFVLNEINHLLMIFRRGKWDLPKGKLDKNESIEDCAIREVMEETGVKELRLVSPLTITYHTYHAGTKFILKESHWFMMRITGQQQLVPQLEEDIHEIRWVDPAGIRSYLDRSFPLIEDILAKASQEGFISF